MVNSRNAISRLLPVAAGLLVVVPAAAGTPRLNITTKSGSPIEERKKQQIERLAKQHDLRK